MVGCAVTNACSGDLPFTFLLEIVQASSVLSLNLEEFLWLPKGFLGLSSPTESMSCRTNECSGPGLYTTDRRDEAPPPQPPCISNIWQKQSLGIHSNGSLNPEFPVQAISPEMLCPQN